jgi:hypothetical protein
MSGQERHDDLDIRLDRALDALAAGQAPPYEDDDEYAALVDAARVARRLRDPDLPDESFATDLASLLARELSEDSQNGHVSRAEVIRLPAVRASRRRGRWLLGLTAALLRVLGAGVIAGMLAGLLAIGIGGRIAMRVGGALYQHEHPGATTVTDSSGQQVGVISLAGTLDLLVQGMFAGALGGLMYVMLRRWLPDARRTRALASGALILLIAGTVVVNAENQDFGRIGIPWLNVLMFGLIIVLFGYLVAPLAEWLIELTHRNGQSGFRRIGITTMKFGVYCAGGLGLLITLQLLAVASIAGPIDFFRVVANGGGFIEILTFIVVMSIAVPIPILNVLASRLALEAAPPGLAGFLAPRQPGFVRAGRWLLIFAAAGGLALLVHAIGTILTN